MSLSTHSPHTIGTARPFKQVDVFTDTPYFGNPLAVVLDGSGLSDEAMQRFARWTNLSETTFVLPPTQAGTDAGADYRVRIFTPGGELPFAGHPTLGSCHAWLEAGGSPRASGIAERTPQASGAAGDAPKASEVIVQECQVGLVSIRRHGASLAFAAPALKRSTPSPELLAKVITALGLAPAQVLAAQLLDNGPVWLGLLLDSTDTVLTLEPDHLALKNMQQKVGVAAVESASTATNLIARSNREARAFADHAADHAALATPDLEVRGFAAPVGINEDPVTGSLNASLAQWLIAEGHLPERYLAAQGTCLGRAGRVHIERDASGQVWVGSQSVTCIDGKVQL
jgi:PhzF family phenazine biosynthesis protein